MQFELTNTNFKLIFEQRPDRWEHRVVIFDGEVEMTLLRSREGNPQQMWPPSPPLQNVSYHELPAGDAILAVGMAGSSHWSASFSVETNASVSSACQPPFKPTRNKPVHPFRHSILADIACLYKKAGPESNLNLLSSYNIEPNSKVIQHANGVLEMMHENQSVSIEPVADSDGISLLTGNINHVSIFPKELERSPRKPTRWRYRFVCQQSL